jgi:hypothetical protein
MCKELGGVAWTGRLQIMKPEDQISSPATRPPRAYTTHSRGTAQLHTWEMRLKEQSDGTDKEVVNYVGKRPSWETDCHSAGQEINSILHLTQGSSPCSHEDITKP